MDHCRISSRLDTPAEMRQKAEQEAGRDSESQVACAGVVHAYMLIMWSYVSVYSMYHSTNASKRHDRAVENGNGTSGAFYLSSKLFTCNQHQTGIHLYWGTSDVQECSRGGKRTEEVSFMHSTIYNSEQRQSTCSPFFLVTGSRWDVSTQLLRVC